jgi:hypothetical protein
MIRVKICYEIWGKSIKGYWGKNPKLWKILSSYQVFFYPYLSSEELGVLLRICFFSSALTCYTVDCKLAKT